MSNTATIVRSTGMQYTLRTDDGAIFTAHIKGKMRLEDIRSTNPLAVGDRVVYEADGDEAAVTQLLPRRNCVVRRATNLSKETHVLAANVDQALLVVTINYPVTTAVFIDRFLASAEAYDVPVVLVFNKMDRYDLAHLDELARFKEAYIKMGYPTIEIAAKHDIGLEQVREVLKDKVSVVAGHSGVGKSTLINHIQPGLNLKTDEISDANRTGKHTTTYAEMHSFDFGGYIIDTPGIRGFGLTGIPDAEVGHYFRDIFAASADCKYPNCRHLREPGCAVKQAVDEERIALSRYHSYVSILTGSDAKYR